MPRYVMAIDASKCLNCKACLLACQQRNAVPYGLARNWVRERADDKAKAGWRFQPGSCMHCQNAPCVSACPTHATYKSADGLVLVDESRCIACGGCVRACPYDARHIDPVRRVVDKCDYCAASRAQGLEPACVSVCATHVRVFGDADDPQSAVSQALAAHNRSFVEPENMRTEPSLTYLGALADKHWPVVNGEGPLGFMAIAATGVRWFGALSLFGVVGVFLRQLLYPTEATRDFSAPAETPAPAARRSPSSTERKNS